MPFRNRVGRLRPALVPATLAVLTACLVTPSTPASAGDVNFTKQVGLATVTGNDGAKRPVEFAVDTDGNMWEFERIGSDWVRTNRGAPAQGGDRTQIEAGAGAMGVRQGVRAYVVGKDGNLWEFRHEGEDIGWARLRRPGNAASFKSAVGTEAAPDGAPFVVVQDRNRQLWQYRYEDGDWVTELMGTVPAEGETLQRNAGLGTFRGGAYAFTVSNRNKLWSVHKTLDGKWTWFSWGTQRLDQELWSSIGVISYRDSDELQAFMRSDDGHGPQERCLAGPRSSAGRSADREGRRRERDTHR